MSGPALHLATPLVLWCKESASQAHTITLLSPYPHCCPLHPHHRTPHPHNYHITVTLSTLPSHLPTPTYPSPTLMSPHTTVTLSTLLSPSPTLLSPYCHLFHITVPLIHTTVPLIHTTVPLTHTSVPLANTYHPILFYHQKFSCMYVACRPSHLTFATARTPARP